MAWMVKSLSSTIIIDVQAVLSRITSDDFNVDKVEKKNVVVMRHCIYNFISQQDAANKINFVHVRP